MTIQIDSREKARAIKKILETFKGKRVNHHISKLYVGDYMNLDNPRLIIDRKQNLTELCSNVCQDHDRFRAEIQRANEAGIQLIFLVEHGQGITKLDDVEHWENPRRWKRIKDESTGTYKDVETKAMKGSTLYKVLQTMERKYDTKFLFCDKYETGDMIITLLDRW